MTEELVQKIRAKIAEHTAESFADAARLASALPPAEAKPGDEIPHLIVQVGEAAEVLDDLSIAQSLFERALEYDVANKQVHAGAWFRLGLVRQRLGDLLGAMDAFRAAIRFSAGWQDMTGLAQFRLAEILITAEEFDEAIQVLGEIPPFPANPHLDAGKVELRLARAQLLAGQVPAAEVTLEAVRRGRPCEATVEADVMLAEIHESRRDAAAARAAYRRIVENPFAKTETKAAAIYRLEALGR